MNFTVKTDLLMTKDQRINNKFDARITQAPIRGFQFEYSIPSKLKKGDTIEFARIPPRGKVIGIILENSFEDVEFDVRNSNGDLLGICTGNKLVSTMAPKNSSDQSIYLTIIKGKVKTGQAIFGVVQYIGV